MGPTTYRSEEALFKQVAVLKAPLAKQPLDLLQWINGWIRDWSTLCHEQGVTDVQMMCRSLTTALRTHYSNAMTAIRPSRAKLPGPGNTPTENLAYLKEYLQNIRRFFTKQSYDDLIILDRQSMDNLILRPGETLETLILRMDMMREVFVLLYDPSEIESDTVHEDKFVKRVHVCILL
jgi:hypothetical protein